MPEPETETGLPLRYIQLSDRYARLLRAGATRRREPWRKSATAVSAGRHPPMRPATGTRAFWTSCRALWTRWTTGGGQAANPCAASSICGAAFMN